MKEDRIVRYIQLMGIVLFYAFVGGVLLFLLNGIRNGWAYHRSSAPYELSFEFALVISVVIAIVFLILTFVVSVVFFRILRDDTDWVK